MINFLTFTLLLLSTQLASAATFVECSILNEPEASILKIKYVEDAPVQLFLRSPGSETDRPQDLLIETIDQKSFTAKPVLQSKIDWKNEHYCFKEIGTQLYFILNFDEESFGVYLNPYFARQDEQCIPPRVRPQPKALSCSMLV